MDEFVAGYLANLASSLALYIFNGARKSIQERLSGTEQQQALNRCTQAGLSALLATAAAQSPERTHLLADIFKTFFGNDELGPEVGQEIAVLFRGKSLNRPRLAELFAEAGFAAETLPSLDFEQAITAFEAAFITTAVNEPALQPLINTTQAVIQTRLLEEMLPGIQVSAVQSVAQTRLLQELVQREQAKPPDPPDVRRRYLEHLAGEINRLPWFNIAREYADPEKERPPRLAEIYIALDTTEFKQVDKEEGLRHFLLRLAQEKTHRIPALEMVNRRSRLLILGDPGSGKSTFINYLAYLMAQIVLVEEPAAWLAEQLAAWHHDFHLPIKIELRALAGQLAGVKKGEAHLILTHLHESLQSWRLEDCWPLLDQAIRSKDAPLLVLLDGLDEASTVLRPVLVQAVQDFVTRYPQHRYVVTCRPYAYVGQPWQLNGFTNVTLAPFNTEQIEQFTITWYRELAGRGGLSPLQAGEKARQLQEALRRNDLRELAPRPLLLTVMTLLHTFRGKLPEDRTELYADAVDLLLRRWEQRIGGEAGLLEQLNIPGLKMSTLEEGLYKVAFQAHSAPGAAPGQTADISEADLRAWLAPYLGQSWDKAGDFIAYIRERAGLLVRHKTEAYTFPHRTFQEFLAACHLVVQPDYPGQAARLARTEPDRWREVFILAAGHATRTHRLSLAIASVNDLCPAALEETARPDAAAFRRAMLAGETLLEIGLNGLQREEAGQAVLKRIRSWLAAAMRADRQLKPVERAAAGNVLARLGDLRPGVGLRSDGLPDITWRPVPAGPFRMGSDKKKDRSAEEAEFPQHEVNLPAYQISLYPVTNAHYGVFVADGGYTDKWRRCWTKAGSDWKGNRTEPDQYGDPFDLPNHPLVGVSWYEAVAFCHWLTLRFREAGELGPEQVVRLPSEAEWEKAARGPAGRIYPWGDQPDPNRANDGETGLAATSPVGCFPGGLSPYQCEEMAGNVWEWCLTKWQDNYKGYRDNNELEGQAVRVLRGGSWLGGQNGARCAVRYWDSPNFRLRSGGFRLVVSAIF